MPFIRGVASSVVGKTDENHWGQVLLAPTAYGIIEIEDADGIARQRGVQVLTKLTRQVNRDIVSMADVREAAESVWEESAKTVILLVPVGSVVYLVLKGVGSVFLKRGESLSHLMGEEGAISGEVQPGDVFLLASAGFTAAMTSEELSQVFDNLSPQEVSEKLTVLLHGKENGRGGAALIFSVAELVSQDIASGEEEEPPQARAPFIETLKRTHGFFRKMNVRRIVARARRISVKTLFHRMLLVRERRPRLAMVVALVFLLFFGVSVFLGIRRQTMSKRNVAAESTMSDAQHLLEEGQALMDLNAVKGRERLHEAKDLLEPLLATLPERSEEGKAVRELSKQIEDNLTQALRIVRFEPQLFFDVSLIKKDARVSAFSVAGDTMGIIDGNGETVYRLMLPTKNGQVMAGGEPFAQAISVAATVEDIYVLTGDGIETIRTEDKKVLPAAIRRDSAWGNVQAVAAYGGNLYVLDTGKSRIWKYVGTDTGFSSLREYLNPDTLLDLSRATGMVIDGSVWAATADGRVLRFTQGKEQSYDPQGVEPVLGSNLSVYTSDAEEFVYVSDPQNTRVVVLDKDGMYISQYAWEGSFSPTGIAASESLKKLFFVADGKIYATDLK